MMHLTNFSHAGTVLIALVVIVTYGLNIGALSEANILVNPDPAVTAELVMSSFLLLLSALAVASVFVHIGSVEWWVEQRHLVLTFVLSSVVLATYVLNLLLIDLKTIEPHAKHDTGLSKTETILSGVLVGVAGLFMLLSVLRFFFGGGSAGSSYAARNRTLIKQLLGGGDKKAAVDPVAALAKEIAAENAAA